MGRLRAWLGPSLLVVLVGAGLAYAFWPRPVPVDLAAVDVGPLAVTAEDDGETRVRELYTVAAPVAGRVLRTPVDAGDAVVAGETVVATIVPSDPGFLDIRTRTEQENLARAAEAARAVAAAEVRRNEAEVDFARSEFERKRVLFNENHVAKAALDKAGMELATREAALETARATSRQRDFELETARAALIVPSGEAGVESEDCCLALRAPVDGVVLRILQESETVVAAGTPLVELGDPRDLEIVADFLSVDAVAARPGDPVRIERWGGDGVLEGRVRRIEPYGVTKVSALGIEEQRVNVVIDFVGPPEARAGLGHGFQVEVAIVLWAARDVVRVPLAALFRVGDSWAAFRVDRGRARQAPVALGHMNDEAAEVLDGLATGDIVVLHPSDRVVDGASVAARDGAE